MKRSLLADSVALAVGLFLVCICTSLAWVGTYPPVGHIESAILNAQYGYMQDGVGFPSGTTVLDSIKGMATVDYGGITSQAEADTLGLTYEIYMVEDRNSDGEFNALDDVPEQAWALVIRVVCDGAQGHTVGWDGNEGSLLQGGALIGVEWGRGYLLKLRVIDGVGNTSTEVGGADVWHISGADSYISRNGDAAQGLDDNEVLWIRIPTKPPPSIGGATGVTTTSATTTTTTTTVVGATTTTTTLPPEGALWTTGNNAYGQLGLGDEVNRMRFIQVGDTLAGKTVTAFAGGTGHSLALVNDGTVWATGHNTSGQLGLGDAAQRTSFTLVGGGLAEKTITAIAAGAYHSVVLVNDGTVWATGYNATGQLGLGDNTNRNVFTQVGGGLAGKTITAIAGGDFHSLALVNDGTVWATGNNAPGQLGLGDNADRNVFTQVGGGLAGKTVTAIACGWSHSLALVNDGTVWATGHNSHGQLGLGDNTNRNVFTQVGGLAGKTSTAIAAGQVHSLALINDGTVWATGYNATGQLGLGDNTNRNVFTQVGGLAGKTVTAVTGGNAHSLALANDGTVWATGFNSSGQLGLGDVVNRTTFTLVGGALTGNAVTFLAAGGSHSLVFTPQPVP